jgi:hypothetical protein
VHSRLAVGRVIVYKSRGLDKTGGPFSYHTSLEPGLEPGSIDDKSTLDAISREGRGCVPG